MSSGRRFNLGAATSSHLNTNPTERRVKTSCWHVTINSNKVKGADGQFNRMIENALVDAIQAPLAVENRGKVFYFDHEYFPNDNWTPNIEGFPPHVFSMNIEFANETGPQEERMHIHGIICVKHDSNVKININELRSVINQTMSEETGGIVTNPYIYLRFLSNSVEIAKRYIAKNIPTNQYQKRKG